MSEAESALRNLSIAAGGPNGMSRRSFLQALGIGAGAVGAGAAIAGSTVLDRLEAFGVTSTGPDDGILVLVMLDGGNDGLNTVIPYANADYRALRPGIRYDAPGTGANAALDTGVPGLGLHPSLVDLRQRYLQGQVAIVNGVGYTPPDLSHFTSMGYWMNGWTTAPPNSYANGWVGRYLDTLTGAASEELLGVSIGQTVPLHMIGSVAKAAGLPTYLSDAFGMDRTEPSDVRLFDTVAGYSTGSTGLDQWGDGYARTMQGVLDLAVRVQPAYAQPNNTDDDIVRQLRLVARLINAGLGTRVFHTHLGGFDTHADQRGQHANLLGDFDRAISTFFSILQPEHHNNVTILTFSEFGRRPEENEAGTDHGTAGVNFLIGPNVAGGMHGTPPGLARAARDRYGNLVPTVDFRSVYANVLLDWLQVDPLPILGGNYPSMGLIARAPNTNPPGTYVPPPRPTLVRRTRRSRVKTG
jgi:uncharacterized protein (DUF1501 family)